jgi:predicted TIM-barrel fold metal-dependent hydrolase
MDKGEDFSKVASAVKSQYFNHPEIWCIVLNEFPGLRLNLAHFGGDRNEWRDIIVDMINSNKYQNLYTDSSCRTDPDESKYIRDKYDASDAVKRRLMYGTDFTIVLMYADLIDYRNEIETAFPLNQHQDIYCDNAKRFLNLT